MGEKHLLYYTLTVRIAAKKQTIFKYWIGASMRNKFLYACSKVFIANGKSFYEILSESPLDESHPWYKELKGGWPTRFLLNFKIDADMFLPSIKIDEGEVFSFKLILIGSNSIYLPQFIQALRIMCEEGLGEAHVPFTLIDITEKSPDGKESIIAIQGIDRAVQLQYPVFLERLFDQLPNKKLSVSIRIEYLTPLSLMSLREKKNSRLSYQAKLNGFPSFYQFVRSALFRYEKLNRLFNEGEEIDGETKETFLDFTSLAKLKSVALEHISVPNTSQKYKDNPLASLNGYIGYAEYINVAIAYLPLLEFMQELGVGNEVIYGLGRYRITVIS